MSNYSLLLAAKWHLLFSLIYFVMTNDPRQASKTTYPLSYVLLSTVALIIACGKGWEDIEDFGRCQLD